MIEAQHLTKRYRKKVALQDVSFTVETGKVTGFLGPNGAGKSTTMRLMLGLDNGGGTTTFDDKTLNSYHRPAEVVGMLLEAKAFHPTRSARQHLMILAQAAGIARQRVDEVLHEVGLQDVAGKGPGKYSLGMSQRLGIAAAILGKPKYLLLDEPANGLDPEGIAWLRSFLKSYAEQGNGVLVSSHLLSEIALMADNVIVIGKGKLIASTSIADMLAKSSRSSVFVRAATMSKLQKTLQAKDLHVQPQDNGLLVSGASMDDVGRAAFGAGIAVLELRAQSATLEQAFLDLTADSTEYSNHRGEL